MTSTAAAAQASTAHELLNRPLLAYDLTQIHSNAFAAALREMVRTYRQVGLPVMNGSFPYSNLTEGPSQVLTCSPYRLWEYTSLFLQLPPSAQSRRFVDVGGAGAPLAYYLGELGWEGIAVDLQPMLVGMARYVSAARGLRVRAEAADIAHGLNDWNATADVATLISVLEHVPETARRPLFEGVHRLLRSGGLFYLTFDYGSYEEVDPYEHTAESSHVSRSISEIGAVCQMLEDCGFGVRGNDPRALPSDVLALKQAPGRQRVMWQHAVTTPPFDAMTPWRSVGKYVANRLVGRFKRRPSRFDHHNFFRLFVEKR